MSKLQTGFIVKQVRFNIVAQYEKNTTLYNLAFMNVQMICTIKNV